MPCICEIHNKQEDYSKSAIKVPRISAETCPKLTETSK